MPWKKSGPMEQRIEFGLKAMGALDFRAPCVEYGISTKTGYKWKERFLREGISGMEEQSSRPHSHAEQLGDETVCEIIRLKRAHGSWGPRKIRELYRRRHGEVASESRHIFVHDFLRRRSLTFEANIDVTLAFPDN
jgi:hypothetical protein